MRVAVLLAAIAAFWVQPAGAAQLVGFHLTGSLIEQTSGGEPSPFGVGTQITLSGSYDPDRAIEWGDTGYTVAGFGANPFSVTSPGYPWVTGSDMADGTPIFEYTVSNDETYLHWTIAPPAVVIKDGKVAGLIGGLNSKSSTPTLLLGSDAAYSAIDHYYSETTIGFGALVLSRNFFFDNSLLYHNTYKGPAFRGVWDFAGSVVSVPEPATWLLMLLGIGAIGAAMRHQSSRQQQEVGRREQLRDGLAVRSLPAVVTA